MISIYNKSRNIILAENVLYCKTTLARMRGLLGSPMLKKKEACWITNCKQIHTFGMKYPLDIYFVNKNNTVLKVIKNIKPGRISPFIWKAHAAIEFCASDQRLCEINDCLELRAVEEKTSSTQKEGTISHDF